MLTHGSIQFQSTDKSLECDILSHIARLGEIRISLRSNLPCPTSKFIEDHIHVHKFVHQISSPLKSNSFSRRTTTNDTKLVTHFPKWTATRIEVDT